MKGCNFSYIVAFCFSLPIRLRYLVQALENLGAGVALRCVWLCHEICMTREVCCFMSSLRYLYPGVLLFQILFQSSLRAECVEEEESSGE